MSTEIRMNLHVSTATRLLACLVLGAQLYSQTPPPQTPSTPDVLLFSDGEKLIGELKSATDTVVVFKSAIGFEVTVPWAKIQELQSSKKFAAIHKSITLHNLAESDKVPVGAVEMKDQKLEISAAPRPQAIPVKELSNVVSEPSFNAALHRKNILSGWKGGANFGLSLTEATVSTRTWNGGLELSRADTSEPWLPVHNRTSLGFTLFNEVTSVPGSPDAKTSIIHSDLVHDVYFKPRVFGFAGATFDHNYNQGLDLLQAYGGGIGVVALKNEKSELDVRAGIGYMRQTYTDPTLNRNLVGSRFNENYSRTMAHGITFFEQAGIRPAWNDMKNYFAGFLLGFDVPVYRRMSLNVSSFDSYVNNPPPFRKKNTFQLTLGLHYTIFR